MNRSIALCLAVVTAGLVAGAASGSSEQTSGTLELNGLVSSYYKFDDAYCPAGVAPTADCVRFTGEGTIPGLGAVTTVYTKLLPGGLDPTSSCVVLQFTSAVITVAGKGTITVANPTPTCGPPAPATIGPFEYSVTGGTGSYAGASGSLSFRSSVGSFDGGCQCGSSQDTWAGSIAVPGVEFDLTAPVISGATSKVVRVSKKAKRARVRYTVTAQDAVDGARPVTCSPASGSSFGLGRTRVSCESTDTSGNAARAQFTVLVRRNAR